MDSFVYLVCLTHLTRLEIINYSHDELLGPVVDMQQRNLQAFDAIQHLKQLQALRMTFCNEFATLPVRCFGEVPCEMRLPARCDLCALAAAHEFCSPICHPAGPMLRWGPVTPPSRVPGIQCILQLQQGCPHSVQQAALPSLTAWLPFTF